MLDRQRAQHCTNRMSHTVPDLCQVLAAWRASAAGTRNRRLKRTGFAPYPSIMEDLTRLTEEEWRVRLSPEAYRVLREHGTERAGASDLNREKRAGTFVCAGCGQPLFSTGTKYESGSGWPSFWAPLEEAVVTTTDRSHFMVRTEVRCARCEGHLGHLFPDGPRPTGERYCMNGAAMRFEPEEP